ncbi:39S ribosomal protein L22, mitochondrial [Sorochytrium milnesiophthora]
MLLQSLYNARSRCAVWCSNALRQYSTQTQTKASSLFDVATKEVQQITQREQRAVALKTDDGQLLKGREHVISTGKLFYSPQKLNMMARQIKGMPLMAAMNQMRFSLKKPAPKIATTLRRCLNETAQAQIGNPSKPGRGLVIAQAWVGKEVFKRGIKIMGRGRFGMMHSPRSHMKIMVRESDVPLAPNRGNRHQAKGGFVAPRPKPKKVPMVLQDKPIYNKWKRLFYDA